MSIGSIRFLKRMTHFIFITFIATFNGDKSLI